MPKKKDAAIIGVVLLLAVALFAVSKMMPKTDLSTKTADVTLAPDAVEYLDETPAPVSYTHLDVYKRQPWRSTTGWWTVCTSGGLPSG